MDEKLNNGGLTLSAEIDKYDFRQEKPAEEKKGDSIEQHVPSLVAHRAPIVHADRLSDSVSVTTTSAERISTLMQSQKVTS